MLNADPVEASFFSVLPTYTADPKTQTQDEEDRERDGYGDICDGAAGYGGIVKWAGAELQRM